MIIKKRIITVLTAAAVLFTGCGSVSKLSDDSATESGASLETASDETQQATEKAVEYTEYVASVPEINSYDTSFVIEAESCDVRGSLYVSNEREGFSGDGYVTGFYGGSADYLIFKADIPSTQHYDITICAAADKDITDYLTVNSLDLASFDLEGDGNFVRITIPGIFMEKGEAEIKLNYGSGNFDVDYIEISNNSTVYEDEFEIEDTEEDSRGSDSTKELLNYLKESFGNKIITGQYASSPENAEMELIYQTTGKYPAIRFSDIGEYTEGTAPSQKEIDAAKDWAEKGGIVGFMWYWNSPSEQSSVYSEDSDFNLNSAVTAQEIWNKDTKELNKLYKQGLISEECLLIINDIDRVSKGLSKLAEEDIPVLWRPLHEAGGDWYWWGSAGPAAYRWLYDLMYKRMTGYHKLDNLIWIWNGQSEDYLVSSSEYDIAALDIYLSPNTVYGSRSEQFYWLKDITGGEKLLAIGECSTIPGIDEMCRDNSLWLFFGLWYGDYIEDAKGELSEVYNSKENLIKIYNAENAVTLESYSQRADSGD